MLTLEKINIYKKFNGDIDGWARIGTPYELNSMNDEDWMLIDEIIQDLIIIKNDSASSKFKRKLESKIRECQISNEVFNEIKQLADNKR